MCGGREGLQRAPDNLLTTNPEKPHHHGGKNPLPLGMQHRAVSSCGGQWPQAGASWQKLLSPSPGMSRGCHLLFWPWHCWRSSCKPEQEMQPCISFSCWVALTQARFPVWFPAATAMLVGGRLQGQNKAWGTNLSALSTSLGVAHVPALAAWPAPFSPVQQPSCHPQVQTGKHGNPGTQRLLGDSPAPTDTWE